MFEKCVKKHLFFNTNVENGNVFFSRRARSGLLYNEAVLRPSVGGGLGVFAFHDVPSRRFAPRSVCFLRLKDAFGGIEISFLLGAPL